MYVINCYANLYYIKVHIHVLQSSIQLSDNDNSSCCSGNDIIIIIIIRISTNFRFVAIYLSVLIIIINSIIIYHYNH